MRSVGRGQRICNVSRRGLTLTTKVAHPCLDSVRANGTRPSRTLRGTVSRTLRHFGPSGPLRVLFSCIQVHFPAASIGCVIRSILQLGLPCFVRRSCNFCSCARRCCLKSVFVLMSPRLRGKILLRLGKHNYHRFRDCLLTRRQD